MNYKDFNNDVDDKRSIRLQARLIHVGYEDNPPSWMYVEHSHPFIEMIMLLNGNEIITINGKNYKAYKNDLILINSFATHKERGLPQNGTREAVVVSFDSFKLSQLPSGCLIAQDASPILHLQENSPIKQCFLRILEEMKSDDVYSYGICSAILNEIVYRVLKYLNCGSATEEEPAEGCKKVKEYIDENYKKPMTLDSLAQIALMSKGYLSHLFKDQYGISPIKYLNQKRIEEAKNQLLKTSLSIDEIACCIGYDSVTYFSQAFYKETGVSPKSYRKYNRSE